MNIWHQFLWIIFPYLALLTFVLGHVYRYVYDQYGWTPKSSQILERRMLMWGVLLFHWGFLFVFGGHVMGLLVPIGVYQALGVSDHNYHLIALWVGAPVGVVALIGILLLNLRRWFIPRIRANTSTMKYITDALLLVVILLGLGATIGYRIYSSQYELQGEFEYRDTIGAWFRSLFYFSPQPSFMVGAPVIFQIHALSAFVLFALWPFSSLVHIFSMPLGYLRRSHIQYRSSNPKASMARERTRKANGKADKVPEKVEQSRRVE
ncbi:respiratory nitrate reductase subunit gamma [soil metagenome]